MSKKATAEAFGNVTKQHNRSSAGFGRDEALSEKTPEHVLTVRQVARFFENSGIPRTERSIVNWCQRNRHGITRLDAYFDENENKYFITRISVERVLAEEQNKLKIKENMAVSEKSANILEGFGNASQKQEPSSEGFGRLPESPESASESRSDQIAKLELKVLDLTISNRGKDYVIGQLRSERKEFISDLIGQSKTIGELETKLKLLEAPKGHAIIEAETGPESGDDRPSDHGGNSDSLQGIEMEPVDTS